MNSIDCVHSNWQIIFFGTAFTRIVTEQIIYRLRKTFKISKIHCHFQPLNDIALKLSVIQQTMPVMLNTIYIGNCLCDYFSNYFLPHVGYYLSTEFMILPQSLIDKADWTTFDTLFESTKAIDLSTSKTRNEIFLPTDTCYANVLTEWNSLHLRPEMIAYHHPSYLYYPYLDSLHCSQKMTMDQLPTIFNTNGFYPLQVAYTHFYPRFKNAQSGLFVRKRANKPEIPLIIHHLWINASMGNDYLKKWAQMIREPWIYRVWTLDCFLTEFKDTRWVQLHAANIAPYHLAIKMAILEKYGGFVVENCLVPLRWIPNEMTAHHLVLAFKDELRYGTRLAYSFIGAAAFTIPTAFDQTAITRFQLGMNNYFIHLRLPVTTDTHIHPYFYHCIYHLLTNRLPINDYLLSVPNCVVYPSYYFNPKVDRYPTNLTALAICSLNKKQTHSTLLPKTELLRTHKLTVEKMMDNLQINPADYQSN